MVHAERKKRGGVGALGGAGVPPTMKLKNGSKRGGVKYKHFQVSTFPSDMEVFCF
jgi:hypothetical protein